MTTPDPKPDALRLTLRNTLAELPRVNREVQAMLESRATPPAAVFAAHLVIEEMITNIIKYGYDDGGPHDINLILTFLPDSLTIRIEDDGHEFNPLALPAPDMSTRLEQRKIGGLGIHLVRHTAADINYQRQAGRNLLTMLIRI